MLVGAGGPGATPDPGAGRCWTADKPTGLTMVVVKDQNSFTFCCVTGLLIKMHKPNCAAVKFPTLMRMAVTVIFYSVPAMR